MNGTARHYFARGNTARGAHFLYDSAFGNLDRLFLLQGLPGTGKSTTLLRLANALLEEGRSVELFHSPINPDELDALIIPELKAGIADELACLRLPTDRPDVIRFDYGQAMDESRLSEQDLKEIEALQEQLRAAYAKAYDTFAEALRIHDEWEKVYIASMDFRKADRVAQELADSLFSVKKDKRPTVRHLFFGAATPKGAVDHIRNLTADLKTRVYIKGRPGSGKSTMLKRLAAAAEKSGYDVDVFHCGFDPNSLDMLIVPELRYAIFDSTAPHEYFPERGGDVILDMYERTMEPGTDEKYAADIAPIKRRYSDKMKEATSCLGEARELDANIKAYYTEATDFAEVSRIHDRLRQAIDELAIRL